MRKKKLQKIGSNTDVEHIRNKLLNDNSYHSVATNGSQISSKLISCHLILVLVWFVYKEYISPLVAYKSHWFDKLIN